MTSVEPNAPTAVAAPFSASIDSNRTERDDRFTSACATPSTQVPAACSGKSHLSALACERVVCSMARADAWALPVAAASTVASTKPCSFGAWVGFDIGCLSVRFKAMGMLLSVRLRGPNWI